MAVTIKMSVEDLEAAQERIAHIKGGFEKALARASQRVARQGVTLIQSDITSRVNIKKRDIGKQILRNKKRGRTAAEVELDSTPRFPLKYFGAKQAKKGVSFRIGKTGKREVALGAFGPEISRLGNHVFRRATPVEIPKKYKSRNKTAGKRYDNLPLVPLFGVSPWGVFMKNKLTEPTTGNLAQKFAARVQHEIDYLLAQSSDETTEE